MRDSSIFILGAFLTLLGSFVGIADNTHKGLIISLVCSFLALFLVVSSGLFLIDEIQEVCSTQ